MPRLSLKMPLFAAALGAMLAIVTAAPAWAGFGAIAYDQQSGHSGAAWNQGTPAQANQLALKQCASANCRVHPVQPAGCGALARNDIGKAWGGADRTTLAGADHTATLLCEKHATAGTCRVVVHGCNQ